MAGKNQHYVPKLLQRGFLADPPCESNHTWRHLSGGEVKLKSIKSVGSEDWFYSHKAQGNKLTLDDVITDFEQELGRDVSGLRKATLGSIINPEIASRTVTHLVTRTAHLRRTITSGMTSATNEIEALFTDLERLSAMIGLSSPGIASAVVDAIGKAVEDMAPAGLPQPLAERLLTLLLREHGTELIAHAITALEPLFPTLLLGFDEKVRDMHNSLLEKPLEDHGWVAALSRLTWSVEGASDLILPDAVALASEAGGNLMPLLFSSAADVLVVLMPVAHNRMLIGRRDAHQLIDLCDFNAQAAANCEEFFIAARSFEDQSLTAMIGTGKAAAIKESISQVIREAEEVRLKGDGALTLSAPQQLIQKKFSYSLTLQDFGDTGKAKEYGRILQVVVSRLARDFPLHELDGITIGVDYGDALAKLDRGSPDLPPASSGAQGYGVGVAMPVTVIRGGVHKQHLVMAAGIAEGWISDDPDVRAASLHVLIKMLASIAHSTRYAAALERLFEPGLIERELHLAVAQAPSGYWSARQSGFAAPNEGRTHADLVIASLDHTSTEIASARSRMADDSDVGEVFQIALGSVSAVLTHAANWLGHRDGLSEGQLFEGSDLPDRLAAYGLERWLVLFGRDLSACYAEGDELDLSVIATLSRHVERLFWSFGVYCWPEEDDVRCVVNDWQFRLPSVFEALT
jgi:hypothetical protein